MLDANEGRTPAENYGVAPGLAGFRQVFLFHEPKNTSIDEAIINRYCEKEYPK